MFLSFMSPSWPPGSSKSSIMTPVALGTYCHPSSDSLEITFVKKKFVRKHQGSNDGGHRVLNKTNQILR